MNKMWRRASALIGAFSLSACGLAALGPPAPNFCKAENRRIPDSEMKGRLLLSLWKKHRSPSGYISGGLPDYMETYVAEKVSANASDEEVRVALTRFAQENPQCCRLDSKELENLNNPALNASMEDGSGRAHQYFAEWVAKGYFANFRVNSEIFQPNDNLEWQLRINTEVLATAYNCGNAIKQSPWG